MEIAISGAIEFHILHTPSSCSCIQWLSCPVHIYTENAYISVTLQVGELYNHWGYLHAQIPKLYGVLIVVPLDS